MSSESLGGSLPVPGMPVVVKSGGDRVDVFGIDNQGAMVHWTSQGSAWSGPQALAPATGGVPLAYPCAIALADGSLHVFAIGGRGQLVHWAGPGWGPPTEHFPSGNVPPLPAGPNGLAVASPEPGRIDVFGITNGGPVVNWTFSNGQLVSNLVLPGGAPTSVPAAVSSGPGKLDLFAIGATGRPMHWAWQGAWSGPVELAGPGLRAGNNGLTAISIAPGQIDLFGICVDATIAHWAGTPIAFAGTLPRMGLPAAYGVPDGVVASVAVAPDHLEVFANGVGNQVLRWQRIGGTWGPVWSQRWPDGNPLPVEVDVDHANLAGIAAVARGGRVDAFTLGKNGTLQHWPGGDGVPGALWQDWLGARRIIPVATCHPSTREELVAIVRRAERDGKHVHACGSHWSYSAVAVTDDYLVETDRLDKVLDVVTGPGRAILNGNAAGLHLVHVEAGIKVSDLMKYLDGKGLAPLAAGGSAGQTLAGALSTSVHGSDFDRGPMPDMVRAIHLIVGGAEHWIEPGTPLTDRAALQAALGPDVQIHYDDDWFDSALVAVGALGIIYSVVIEAAAQHDLEDEVIALPWSELRARLLRGVDFEGKRGLQLAIDPAAVGPNRPCYLSTRRPAPATGPVGGGGPSPSGCSALPLPALGEAVAALVPGSRDAIKGFLGALGVAGPPAIGLLDGLISGLTGGIVPPGALTTLLAGAGALTTAIEAALEQGPPGTFGDILAAALDNQPGIQAMIVSVLTEQMAHVGYRRGWAHTILSGDDTMTKLARGPGFEAAFDCTDGSHLRFVDEVLAMLERERGNGHILGGWLSMRFVGHSRAHLSPQRSIRTCMVEATGMRGLTSTDILLGAMEAACARHHGIPHWSLHRQPIRRDEVRRAYPNLDTWRRVRYELTHGGARAPFDNGFAIDAGLTEPPARHVTTPTMTTVTACFDAGVPGELFGLGSDGRAWRRSRTIGKPPIGVGGRTGIGIDPIGRDRIDLRAGSWTKPFVPLGAATSLTKLVVAHNQDGRLEAFAVDAAGALWHTWQQGGRTGPFGAWVRLTGMFVRDVAVALNSDGALEVFGPGRGDFGPNPRFQHLVQQGANGGWIRPTALGNATGLRRCVVGANQDGRLEVFAIDDNPGLWHAWQMGGGAWSPWVLIPGHDTMGELHDLAVANHADGRLIVFGLGLDGRVNTVAQTERNGNWSDWSRLGDVAGLHQLVVARDAQQRLQLWGLDGGDGVLRLSQTSADGSWSAWSRWSAIAAKQLAVSADPDGRLELFAIDQAWAIQHASQDAAGAWSDWTTIS